MNPTSSPSPDATRAAGAVVSSASGLGPCLARATKPLAVLAVSATLVLWFALGDEARLPACLGVGAAFVASFVALVLEARALCAPARDRADGMRFQVALALGFAVLFFSLCGSVLALHLSGVKFAIWSAFALAFAGAAFVLHVAGALVLMRARTRPSPTATSACRAA